MSVWNKAQKQRMSSFLFPNPCRCDTLYMEAMARAIAGRTPLWQAVLLDKE